MMVLSESIFKAHRKSSLMFYTTGVVIWIIFFNKRITTAYSSTTKEDKEIKAMSQLVNRSQNLLAKGYTHEEETQQNSARVSLIYQFKEA